MEALVGLYFQTLLLPLAVAFMAELAINRRPVVVALVVASIFSFALTTWLSSESAAFATTTIADYIAFFGFNLLFGGLAALLGSSTARGLRLLIELRQDRLNTED